MNEAGKIYPEKTESDIRDYLRIIQKRKAIVILFFVVTVTLVIAGTLRMKPVYEATTQVLVEKNESASLTTPAYSRFDYDQEFYITQLELIGSQNVARKVVNILNMEETYQTYFPEEEEGKLFFVQTSKNYVKKWIEKIFQQGKDEAVASTMPITEKSEEINLVKLVQENLQVETVPDSMLINITYRSTNPEFARLVTDTIATAYKDEVMEIQMNSTGYALGWMNQKAEEEKTRLVESEIELQAFMKKHDIITVEDRIAILPQQLTELTTRYAFAQNKATEIENLYKQVLKVQKNKGDFESLSIIATKPEMQQVLDDIRMVRQEIVELSQTYGHKHPLLIEKKNKLADLQRQLKLKTAKAIATVKNEYEAALAQEKTLQLDLLQAKQEALNLNEKMMEYNLIKRDVNANRSIHEMLVMRTKEENLTGNIRNVNVWVTQNAETPEYPIKPNKKIIFPLAVFLGLFGGIGMVFFVENLDNTIKDPDETERKTGYPVIGVIELLKKKNADYYAKAEPTSSFAESIISLRTSLLLSSADKPPKTVLITSVSPGEGKSTIALNLAQSVAQMGQSVLLIDADLRRPRVHKAFGVSNTKGLSSYLAGADSSITTHWDENNNISILCSGPIPPNPSELLSASRFPQLLDESKNKFDMIIIDSPPVLSAADASILSKNVEKIIVVTKYGETTNVRLRRVLKSLQEINVQITGLVINGMDMKKSDYFSYYGYYQYSATDKKAPSN